MPNRPNPRQLPPIRFHSKEIEQLDLRNRDELASAFANLCGEEIKIRCGNPKLENIGACGKCQACINWEILSQRLKAKSFGHEELNDILLLANQRPMTKDFFEFFFQSSSGRITQRQVKQGITRFQGYALLCYGNVRFAYRKLCGNAYEALVEGLLPYSKIPTELQASYRNRPVDRFLPAQMPADKTGLLGYIAKGKADQDLATYGAIKSLASTDLSIREALEEEQQKLFDKSGARLKADKNARWRKVVIQDYESKVTELQKSVVAARRNGWLNTTHYLAIDFMDVYVATSMREQWEFEDINKTVAEIFNHKKLKDLNLRYFDPTQSHLDFRIDKGLVESLMLKRALCTVYLVQESDTFGKDSELAATLAQGKPVIAYLPKIDVSEKAASAERRPLAYLQSRLSQLAAESKISPHYVPEVFSFLHEVSSFWPLFNFSARDEERVFLRERKLELKRKNMCRILAEAEQELFESRDRTLRKVHPLAIQVHLDSGVANGVLVVRSIQDCAELLYRLVTNTLEFEIKTDNREGATLLIESVSGCPFRVQTKNGTINNSFWSFYLTANRRTHKLDHWRSHD